MLWFATDYWIPSILLGISVSAAPVCFWIGTPTLIVIGYCSLICIPMNLSSIRMTTRIRAAKAEINQIQQKMAE